MKILLSAYACEPDKGSEPGVGWNWAIELNKLGHEVYVITRLNNQPPISALLDNRPVDKLHFIYYDLPGWLSWWKKGRRGVHLYYLLWQIGIYRIARSLTKTNSFDVIHHVTFVSLRQPSFLGLLGVPFIFGPAAGGECAPMPLRKSYPWKGWLTDAIRDIANSWVRLSPLMWLTFNSAERIYVTSEQSRKLIPRRYQKKTLVKIAIGTDNSIHTDCEQDCHKGAPRILYVGHLLYWKGVHLALNAFAILLNSFPDSKLTILGNGADEMWLKNISVELGVDHAVDWLEWVPRSKVDEVYKLHDVFIFPSLHDSGGMVVLEAMKNCLPVVCLDLGGPGVTVDDSSGYKIKTDKLSVSEVIEELGEALLCLFQMPNKRQSLAGGASKRARQLRWESLVKSTYGSGDKSIGVNIHNIQ